MSEPTFQINEQEWQEFQTLMQKLEAAETDNFLDLATLLGRNPKTDLAGADLRGVKLISADLIGANLGSANLSSADLGGADLIDANLGSANLSSADLSGAYLSDADLSGADLSGAIVAGCRFGAGIGLTKNEKVDLQRRGGIFDDAMGDRDSADTPSPVRR